MGRVAPRAFESAWLVAGRSSSAVVVSENAAESIVAVNRPDSTTDLLAGRDDRVLQPLVVSRRVIMANERGDGSSERINAEEDHSVQQFGLGRKDPSLANGIAVGCLARSPDALHGPVAEQGPELVGELAVSVDDQVRRVVQNDAVRVGEVPGDLLHEVAVGRVGDAEDLDPAGRQADGEEHVHRAETAQGPYLDREEVGGGQGLPVRSQKRLPRSGPLGCGRKPVLLQDLRDGRPRHFVAEVGQRPLDSLVAPGILPGHLQHELPDGRHHGRAALVPSSGRSTFGRATSDANGGWCRQ